MSPVGCERLIITINYKRETSTEHNTGVLLIAKKSYYRLTLYRRSADRFT